VPLPVICVRRQLQCCITLDHSFVRVNIADGTDINWVVFIFPQGTSFVHSALCRLLCVKIGSYV
jgi:hypothetical protein